MTRNPSPDLAIALTVIVIVYLTEVLTVLLVFGIIAIWG